ncbi:YoaK family protein [Ramlibacter sp.]|uniref:YoaK family protein n=1 Tax=Ramlibacter sp. TaxID=1917967 RepID=UPI00260CFD7D|nr:YoaK family protein [Ramlibacter sp.]MDB5955270.1 hypothetical protein [Ramlibacter sp.]
MTERDGPLPLLLIVLTGVTGLVDAVSYLALGRVFVANMTGNVVFLGFAVANSPDLSIPPSLWSLAAFLAGAFSAGVIGAGTGEHRGRLLAVSSALQVCLVAGALALVVVRSPSPVAPLRYALIVLLALAMGLQNATVRRLGVPDLTTTVLTMTLTALASDAALPGGKTPRPGRRLLSTGTMFLGAAVGALLAIHAGAGVVLALALAMLLATAMASGRYWFSQAAWTLARPQLPVDNTARQTP